MGLVRRLAKSGATHVFTSGDRNDTAILARDGRIENIALDIVGGDQLNGADQAVPLANGVKANHHSRSRRLSSAQELVKAMQAEGMVADGYVLPAAAAITIAADALSSAERPVFPSPMPSPRGLSNRHRTVSFTAAANLRPRHTGSWSAGRALCAGAVNAGRCHCGCSQRWRMVWRREKENPP